MAKHSIANAKRRHAESVRAQVATWSYDKWVAEQAKEIDADMRKRAMSGNIYDCAVYVIPSAGATQGKLILANEKPESATDVLRFLPNGSTSLAAVPYSAIASRLWQACRNMPICPTA